ncbi:MAG: DMT family transporter [Bacteroidaceae bacterium]|nr:DMT family transporter [Bacteroidaceae bacterium]
MNPKVKGFTMGSIAAASYGLNPLFALPLYAAGYSVDNVLFYRYAFAIVMLGMMMKIRGLSVKVNRKDLPLLALFGLLFSASSLFLFLSYQYMDAGIASTILFLYPVMVAVIMMLFYHEKPSLITWITLTMTFVGVTLLGKQSDGSNISLMGVTLVMLSSLSYAIYIVGVNHTRLKNLDTARMTFYALLFGILIYVVRLHFCADVVMPREPLHWLCAICLALFPTIISLVTMTISIHHIGSTYAAILGALEPITAVVVGVFVFHERLTPRISLGIVTILVAVTLLIAGKKIFYTLKNVICQKRN